MKLVNSGAGLEISGDLAELADNIATRRAQETGLLTEIQSRLLDDGWLADIPEEVCVRMVKDTGFRLLNDDGTPAARDTIVGLGRMVWEKLVEMAEMGLEEEALPPDVPLWP